MITAEMALKLLDYAIELAFTVIGAETAKQTILDRIEITAARVAADQVAAARFGKEPPG